MVIVPFYELRKPDSYYYATAVVAALKSHGEANAEVAWLGLWVIQNLTATSSANAAELVTAGGYAGLLPQLYNAFFLFCGPQS